MCGIAGIKYLIDSKQELHHHLMVMGELIKHRGPDGSGVWVHESNQVGFAHQRLSIIDLSENASQPMTDHEGNWIVYNGEIYNYREVRDELGKEFFRTQSDTEVILHAYRRWGKGCVSKFRGMFAFAIWDEKEQILFCARDHFGIKPFYYTVINHTFYFASEIKALLPFLDSIRTDIEGLKDYLTFQLCLGEKTLFEGVKELLPAHWMTINASEIKINKYWEVYFEPDYSRTSFYFEEKLRELLEDSIKVHLRSDVPVGSYISGGLDSSAIASIASNHQNLGDMMGFTGKFSEYGPQFDESRYAQLIADEKKFLLKTIDIKAQDFIQNIQKVIYHLDYPVAGPGSFPQFMVSKLAAKDRKVVLGGQGGDEIFGGYTRYLIAYFEQCIKAAIDGSSNNGNFVVTYESIIPNLVALQNYKPMLRQFWSEGLFESMDRRYFQLINRAPDLGDEIRWDCLEPYSARQTFSAIFNGQNVKKESYFDLMTHFDFKTLLPGLLQVEDRMSMAHGLESRVPLLDRAIVELAATIPADIKFKNGNMKHILKQVVRPWLPKEIFERKDKMGFPTPFNDWIKGEAGEFVFDILGSQAALNRDIIDNRKVLEKLDKESHYGRKIWGLLSLELWNQEFIDKGQMFKNYLNRNYE
ncbi:MAG: asparagine synthase (glutamine-hydrolyzing) [Bacteroidales bacterium]|jgi:asparagine synthase (glutamine-hydrolysing)